MLTLILSIVLMGITGCKKNELTIFDIEDIKHSKHAKVGAMTGTTGEALAISNFPAATIKSFDDIMDAVAAIKSGQLDAIVTAFPTALQVTKKNHDLAILAEPLEQENTAIAFRKENVELMAQVNQIIAGFKADGTLQDMQHRWLKPDLSPYEEPDIALPSTGVALKVGVSATREPLTFVDKTGRVSGHDGELARRIGQQLNRPVEFLNMKFMALIPALASGKVDMILTGMTATEERKKHVNFSDPYFSNSQVILIRKTAADNAAETKPQAGRGVMKLADLHDKRIAVLSGSAGDLAAHQYFPQAKISQMVASADAALALKSNKVDAFVYDKSVLLNLADKNPELQILSEPVAKLEIAAAVKKGNDQLLKDINAVILQFKKDGKLQALRAKWIDSKYKDVPALPMFKKPFTKDKLIVGTCAQIEPFSFQANGVLTGLDIELAHLIADKLGRQIEFVDMSFESLIPALQSSKIDIALSNFNVTEERRKLISFSAAYVENDISALVRKSGTASLAKSQQIAPATQLVSSADINGKRIGVLLGSVHDEYATKHYPHATIMQYQSASDIVLAVKSGKVDVAMYDEVPLQEILQHNSDLVALGQTLFSTPIGIGISKENAELRLRFNQFLADIKKNGVYEDMIARWIVKGDSHMPDIGDSPVQGLLHVGVSDVGLPFVAVKDNQLVGFDVELMKRFAAKEGKALKLTSYEFGSLVSAVASGKADLIASSISVTDERKKQIDFSDPYFGMGVKLIALKNNAAQPLTNAVSASAEGSAVMQVADTSNHEPSFIERTMNSFNSNIVQEDRYLLILGGLKVTVIIAVLSTVLGTLLGCLICYMRMSHLALLNIPAKVFISVIRGTPVLVFLMLIYYVVFASININPVLVAVIAFGMNFAAYVSEIFRTGISSIDKGQIEAGIAMGFSKLYTFVYITLPQTIQRILPVYKGEFISLVKMTSIVGYIAVQDLTKASDIIRSRTFDAFFPLVMIAILYFLISWVLMQSLEYLERMTDPKHRRNKRKKA